MMQQHSLWLSPSQDDMSALQNLVDDFCRQTGNTPPFAVHVTLLGDIDAPVQEIFEVAAPVLRGHGPVDLTLRRLSFGENFFMSFFANVEPSGDLQAMHEACATAFPEAAIPQPFVPHMSLAYGALSPAQKAQFAAQAEPVFPVTFKIDRVCVVKASQDTPIEDWTVCHEIQLNETVSDDR